MFSHFDFGLHRFGFNAKFIDRYEKILLNPTGTDIALHCSKTFAITAGNFKGQMLKIAVKIDAISHDASAVTRCSPSENIVKKDFLPLGSSKLIFWRHFFLHHSKTFGYGRQATHN